MADKAIEVLLDERRNFPLPKELKESAHARGASVITSVMKDSIAMFTMSE